MNECEKRGVVRSEDLPSDKIFVYLKKNFYTTLNKKIRNFGIRRLEEKFDSGRKINCLKFQFDFTSCEGMIILSGILRDGDIPTKGSTESCRNIIRESRKRNIVQGVESYFYYPLKFVKYVLEKNENSK
jgi:hypothetical protein